MHVIAQLGQNEETPETKSLHILPWLIAPVSVMQHQTEITIYSPALKQNKEIKENPKPHFINRYKEIVTNHYNIPEDFPLQPLILCWHLHFQMTCSCRAFQYPPLRMILQLEKM